MRNTHMFLSVFVEFPVFFLSTRDYGDVQPKFPVFSGVVAILCVSIPVAYIHTQTSAKQRIDLSIEFAETTGPTGYLLYRPLASVLLVECCLGCRQIITSKYWLIMLT